jgi:hypothetical protein
MKKITLLYSVVLLAGSLFAQTSGGPDAFGYTWINSNDPSGPVFNWIDITTVGTQVAGLTDDNSSASIPMPAFPYYSTTVNQIIIGSNGWIGLGNMTPGNISHCFPSIPSPGGSQNNFVAPFLSDLNFAGAGNPATAWYYDDVGNDRFIVSYINAPYWINSNPDYIGSNTFQVIFSRTDFSITFQYGDMDPANVYNVVGCLTDIVIGIEDATGAIGIEYSRESVPPDNFALTFIAPPAVMMPPVPTLSEWGLIVFILLLLTVGTVGLMSRGPWLFPETKQIR